MTVQFSASVLDRYIAPGISEFNSAEIPDLRQFHDQHSFWLQNHFLNSLLSAAYKVPFGQYAFNALYRIQTSFNSYHEARQLTYEFLSSTQFRPNVGKYFGALSKWETCFLNWQILIDIYKRMSNSLAFQRGDGTPEQRAYDICNEIKHTAEAIKRGEHDKDLTVPMWLKNDGFHSKKHFVSYQEFSQMMLDAAEFADALQNPQEFFKIV